jgi:hypothetical protein
MSGLYSPINRAAESITRPKGTGAEYMAELQKKPGYKPAEAEDRDLQTLMALPQMERAAFMEKLKAQANKFPLKHRELTGGQTHHEQYTLPGGENYREILLHTPKEERGYQTPNGAFFTEQDLADPIVRKTVEKVGLVPHTRVTNRFEGVPHHFGGMPNVLASIRVKDRTTPEGKKMLHLEEIQSDWHQQGREKGYKTSGAQKEFEDYQKHLIAEHGIDDDDRNEAGLVFDIRDNASPEEFKKYTELRNRVNSEKENVPYGPHGKDWHELALKAMIQHAAENGYDQIGITPGAEQAKRFSLSKQVGSVSYNPETKHFQAFKPNRETITNEKGATPERIQALIGKEAAAKLLQAPKTMGHHYLEGENLDIGGEGMKGFYDRMVPSFLNKFGKKHGVQVQQGRLLGNPSERGDAAEALGVAHIPLAGMAPEQVAAFNQRLDEHNAKPVHTFDITPQMREDVLKNGIPRYAEGGEVDDVPRETVKAYKLFRVHPKHPGKLFPLFVNANTPVEMGKWIAAQEGEMANGKVKSKIGPLAYRPGWHAGDLPVATHIGEKSDPTLTAPDLRPENHAWAEVEMPHDVDWQSVANERGVNKQGRLIPSRAHITDQIPVGGHYRYKTNPNMTGNWLIGGSMKVNRILSDKEVAKINKAAGAADLPRAKAFNPKKFGFAEGGTVGPEEWMAEEHVNHKAKGGKAEFISKSKVKDVLYRGGIGHQDMSEDFLKGKARPGYATFASTSPHVAGSYAHPDWDKSWGTQDLVGAIAPMHIKAHTVHEFPVTTDKHGSRKFDMFEFDQHAKQLQPGHALVARQVFDMGPRANTKTDPDRLYSRPSDIYAWNNGTEVKSALDKATGGSVKDKVTIQPSMDVMQYELINRKAK